MKNLAEERVRRGYTQTQMAEAVGCGKSTYSMYENGNRSVPKRVAEAIAAALDLETSDIFLPSWFAVSKRDDVPSTTETA